MRCKINKMLYTALSRILEERNDESHEEDDSDDSDDNDDNDYL